MAQDTPSVPLSVLVDRWSSERPLRFLVWIVAIAIWLALAFSLIGIAYVLLMAIFFFVAHIMFITHLRGNVVRLGREQMPELYERVVALSDRIGLHKVPDAYVVQAGGSLNALATKFLGSNFIVLYSDLLEACGENADARDFIIAHELAHLYAGHLRFRWLLLPGLLIPFLGTAYSRACEYTCDRYGLAASTDSARALDGLAILAAAGKHGPKVNKKALVAQRADLNTIWMKIGHWLSTHPPIAHRLAALQPTLAEGRLGGRPAAVGAVVVIVLAIVVPIAGTIGIVWEVWPRLRAAIERQNQGATSATVPAEVHAQLEAGILSLADAAKAYRARTAKPPANVEQLYEEWSSVHPKDNPPLDPYSGGRYGYHVEQGDYFIWSVGPNPTDDSDNIYYSSQADPDSEKNRC